MRTLGVKILQANQGCEGKGSFITGAAVRNCTLNLQEQLDQLIEEWSEFELDIGNIETTATSEIVMMTCRVVKFDKSC